MWSPSRTPSFDMISIGDTSTDYFAILDDASLLCSLDKKNCWIGLNYAEKIPIEAITITTGGNACNNAVASSRLGMKTALYTIIGDDSQGEHVLSTLKKEAVNPSYIRTQKKGRTNGSIILNYKKERTILVHHEKRTYTLPSLPPAEWIYFTSMGKDFPALIAPTLRYIKKYGVKVGFNPGTHQLLAPLHVLQPILQVTTLLAVNKEEAATLLNGNQNLTVKEMLIALHEMGPAMIVITDGDKGAYGFDGISYYKGKPYPAKLIERTGAGDSFASATIAGLHHGHTLPEAMAWGLINSASVVQQVGPQAGLLKKKELLKKYSHARKLVTVLKK